MQLHFSFIKQLQNWKTKQFPCFHFFLFLNSVDVIHTRTCSSTLLCFLIVIPQKNKEQVSILQKTFDILSHMEIMVSPCLQYYLTFCQFIMQIKTHCLSCNEYQPWATMIMHNWHICLHLFCFIPQAFVILPVVSFIIILINQSEGINMMSQ